MCVWFLKVCDASFSLPVAVAGRFRTAGAAHLSSLRIDTAGVLGKGLLLLVGVSDTGALLLQLAGWCLLFEDLGLVRG